MRRRLAVVPDQENQEKESLFLPLTKVKSKAKWTRLVIDYLPLYHDL